MPSAAELLQRQPNIPFIERPWLLLFAVALLIGIGGHAIWHGDGAGPNSVRSVIDSAVAFYLGVGVLLVPGLCHRSVRAALKHLPEDERWMLLLRMAVVGVVGPGATWLMSLFIEPFGGVMILRMAIVGSFVMSLGAYGGLLIREKYRR